MHHELPQRLDLDWYRARARELLRSFRSADAEARSRVGDRQRFVLADAQHVIAREHGYRNWAEFRRWVETRSPEPPVGRIGRAPLSTHDDRASALRSAVADGDADAVRRVRAHIPRLSQFESGELDLADARLVIAREYGFPTWRDLLLYAQKAIDEYEHRPSGRLAAAFELIRGGDVDGLRKMLDDDPDLVRAEYKGAAATMLEAVAQPDVFGDKLGIALGIDARIVELLIERGSALDTPLNLAACFNRAELVRMLLHAGARAGNTEIWGMTPLQSAIYHGSREAADLLAAVALVPDAFYVAAAVGALDRLGGWFAADGTLLPTAMRPRPNLADVGWPPAPPPLDDAQTVLDEAFALAAYSGRLETMHFLLEHGADVNGSVHLGMTALHMSVITQRVDAARWLIDHGADASRQDQIHHGTPLGWAAHSYRDAPIHQYLAGLQLPLKPAKRPPDSVPEQDRS
jgi:ankyrin repeat protein